MIGGSACHGIYMAIDVLVACVRIIFLELKVFFNRHGSLMLYRHGPLALLPFVICCSGCLYNRPVLLYHSAWYLVMICWKTWLVLLRLYQVESRVRARSPG